MVSGLVRSSRRWANRAGLPAKQKASRVSFCHTGCALRGVGVRAGARMFSPFHGGLYCRARQQCIRVAFARRRASQNGINFRSADGHSRMSGSSCSGDDSRNASAERGASARASDRATESRGRGDARVMRAENIAPSLWRFSGVK